MTSPTINRVNVALQNAGYPIEIVKGDCYFYFAGLPTAELGIEDYITSIFSNHLRDMSVEKYVEHVAYGVSLYQKDQL
jgi:hypothetical protein